MIKKLKENKLFLCEVICACIYLISLLGFFISDSFLSVELLHINIGTFIFELIIVNIHYVLILIFIICLVMMAINLIKKRPLKQLVLPLISSAIFIVLSRWIMLFISVH